jgi:hypothetical protein
MYINKLYIYKNDIYQKIENTLISYNKLGSIKELLFADFQNTILNFFISEFTIHFNNFDFYFLVKSFKLKMENNVLKVQLIANNKINFTFSLMEFNDGIYDIKNNIFIKRDSCNFVKFIKNNEKTIKYYDKSYQRIRQNKPTN